MMQRYEFTGNQPCEITPGLKKQPGDAPFSADIPDSRRDYLVRAGVIRPAQKAVVLEKPAPVDENPPQQQKDRFRK